MTQLKLKCKKHLHWQVATDGDSQTCLDCGFTEKDLWKKLYKRQGYTERLLAPNVTLERSLVQNGGFCRQAGTYKGYGFYIQGSDAD